MRRLGFLPLWMRLRGRAVGCRSGGGQGEAAEERERKEAVEERRERRFAPLFFFEGRDDLLLGDPTASLPRPEANRPKRQNQRPRHLYEGPTLLPKASSNLERSLPGSLEF